MYSYVQLGSRGRLVRLRVVRPRRRPRGELLVRRQRVRALQAVLRVLGVLRVRRVGRVRRVRRVRRRQRGRVRVQRRRTVHIVPVVPVPHAVQHLSAQRVRWSHSLLFLSAIAEPHSYYFLLQLQTVCKRRYFLSRGFWLFMKVLLESSFHRNFYRCALLSFATLRSNFINARRTTCR